MKQFYTLLLSLLIVSCTAGQPPQPQPQLTDATANPAARAYLAFVRRACDQVEADMPYITEIAEIAADRHMKGGIIGIPWNGHGLQDELWGRSGGLVHIGDGRSHKRARTAIERKNDMAIISWQRAGESGGLMERKAAGSYIIAFGPRSRTDFAAHRELVDAWFDTGFGDDDRVVALAGEHKAGRGNLLVSMLHGWAFIAEFVAASTRQGKMPPLWQAYLYDEGLAWGNKYLGNMQYHDDYSVPPIPAGELAGRYLDHIRGLVDKLEREQLSNIDQAAGEIVEEHRLGRKTVCAAIGHAPWTYVAQYEDKAWCDVSHFNDLAQMTNHLTTTADGALVLHLGYFGTDDKALEIFAQKEQRVIYIAADTTRDGEVHLISGRTIRSVPDDALHIDLGLAYGDASVAIKGYPIKALPPSGVMQLVAYECVNVEVLSRIVER